MKLGIERRFMEKIFEIVVVEVVFDEEIGFELNEENIEKVCVRVLEMLVISYRFDLYICLFMFEYFYNLINRIRLLF